MSAAEAELRELVAHAGQVLTPPGLVGRWAYFCDLAAAGEAR